MVEDALAGISSTLFVYGGFNSGKTYTLYGDTLSWFSSVEEESEQSTNKEAEI